jgi:hypothetical protein
MAHKFATLESNQLWFTKASCLNDIFELSPSYEMTPETTLEELSNAVLVSRQCGRLEHALSPQGLSYAVTEVVSRAIAEKRPGLPTDFSSFGSVNRMYHQLLESYLEEIGLMCFSTCPLNQLMWAYYAGSYTGFCVGYEINLEESKDIGLFLKNVNYSKERPTLDIWQMLFSDISKPVVFTKSLAWSHENEVRIAANLPLLRRKNFLAESKDNGFSIRVPKGIKVTEIILGPKISLENKNTLFDIAQKISIAQSEDVLMKSIHVNGYKYELSLQTFIQQ